MYELIGERPCIHARFFCKIRQLAAVVEQRLISPRLNIDRREPLEISMQRVGKRVLEIATLAEEHPGHTPD